MIYVNISINRFVFKAYVPILSNPNNHVGWPAIVCDDVRKHVYDLRSSIHQVKRPRRFRLKYFNLT